MDALKRTAQIGLRLEKHMLGCPYATDGFFLQPNIRLDVRFATVPPTGHVQAGTKRLLGSRQILLGLVSQPDVEFDPRRKQQWFGNGRHRDQEPAAECSAPECPDKSLHEPSEDFSIPDVYAIYAQLRQWVVSRRAMAARNQTFAATRAPGPRADAFNDGSGWIAEVELLPRSRRSAALALAPCQTLRRPEMAPDVVGAVPHSRAPIVGQHRDNFCDVRDIVHPFDSNCRSHLSDEG